MRASVRGILRVVSQSSGGLPCPLTGANSSSGLRPSQRVLALVRFRLLHSSFRLRCRLRAQLKDPIW
jgi:hypothetical protein